MEAKKYLSSILIIDDKLYLPVEARLRMFLDENPDASITEEILEDTGTKAKAKARIQNGEKTYESVASAYFSEDEIGRAYVETAETKALGRALRLANCSTGSFIDAALEQGVVLPSTAVINEEDNPKVICDAPIALGKVPEETAKQPEKITKQPEEKKARQKKEKISDAAKQLVVDIDDSVGSVEEIIPDELAEARKFLNHSKKAHTNEAFGKIELKDPRFIDWFVSDEFNPNTPVKKQHADMAKIIISYRQKAC